LRPARQVQPACNRVLRRHGIAGSPRQLWHCKICNLQNLNDPSGSNPTLTLAKTRPS
jgi:hypothetical protein